jgi:hypothetical protein
MIDNLASRWSKQETEILSQHLESDDYELLESLLPGRTKAGIKAKQKRLLKADPIPKKLIPTMFRYHLEGEADGQIMQRMMKAGYNYTLKDIAVALKKARQEVETVYAEEYNHKPTLDQLREFVNGKKMDN